MTAKRPEAIMVRLTPDQVKMLDAEVKRQNAEPNESLRVTRSLVLRRAVIEMGRLRKQLIEERAEELLGQRLEKEYGRR